MTANVVCESCNNGWMSDIDAEASATMANMIRYCSGVSLLPLGIATIATFAFKTAVVVDCTATHRSRQFFSHRDRKRFSQTLKVPKGVQVWLSTIRTTRVHGRFTAHYAEIHAGRFRGFEFYVLTYSVGFLVIQLSAFKWSSIVKQPVFMPRLTQLDFVWADVSVPLWPPDGRAVIWPTRKYLTDQNVEILADRWRHVAEIVRSS
jgi:hypothetical protein